MIVALTRFKRSLNWVRPTVRSLTHTLHLPPAQAEGYETPHPGWLRDVLTKLPNLQSLVVSQLPFFDHPSLVALRTNGSRASEVEKTQATFALRLLIANQCTNTTPRSLSDALTAFPRLIFLDLSRTLGARDEAVLSKLRHMDNLQILKLCGIQLRDDDMGVLAESIGTRATSDGSDGSAVSSTHPRGLSGAAEGDWPSGILKPDPAVLDEFRDESFDERYLRRLTQGPVSRMPSEDQPNTGITHLYISNNRVTVEGVSCLIKSMRLHVLDAGVIDTARPVHRPSSSVPPSSPYFRDRTIDLPGAEKLTPVLAKYGSKNLTSLRVNHNIITRSILFPDEEPSSEINELDLTPGCHELDAAVPAYELPSDHHERYELPNDSVRLFLTPAIGTKPEVPEPVAPPLAKRGSVYLPEEATDDTHILTATNLGPVSPATNGIQDPKSDSFSTAGKGNADPSLASPYLSRSIIEEQRRSLRSAQFSEPHGLLPNMLPQLRSLSLTDVPCYDESGQVISALIKFIRYCASESELANLQAGLDSKNQVNFPYGSGKPLRQTVANHFALRRITLEMSFSEASALAFLKPGSPRTSQAATCAFRSRSSTEDADSEAFWTAQENDFSFFADDVECGVPSDEPGPRFPVSALSEKVILPIDNEALPMLQHPNQANPGRDVIQELIKFRKDRKAAYESGLQQGHKTAEGYWPGEVKVVRRQGGKTAMAGNYGNYFEKAYIHR
ncbi:MAG: hypothetical protein Q9196_001959 [Gyalolechia fulgens]